MGNPGKNCLLNWESEIKSGKIWPCRSRIDRRASNASPKDPNAAVAWRIFDASYQKRWQAVAA
jgi:hypothetical protein